MESNPHHNSASSVVHTQTHAALVSFLAQQFDNDRAIDCYDTATWSVGPLFHRVREKSRLEDGSSGPVSLVVVSSLWDLTFDLGPKDTTSRPITISVEIFDDSGDMRLTRLEDFTVHVRFHPRQRWDGPWFTMARELSGRLKSAGCSQAATRVLFRRLVVFDRDMLEEGTDLVHASAFVPDYDFSPVTEAVDPSGPIAEWNLSIRECAQIGRELQFTDYHFPRKITTPSTNLPLGYSIEVKLKDLLPNIQSLNISD